MRYLTYKLKILTCLSLIFFGLGSSIAQNIDVNAGYGNYTPGSFAGYGGDTPAVNGIFEASAGKTSGIIPAYTAQITVVLAPEAPWTGAAFTIPDGWEMDPASTPENLTFYNSIDWTTEDPYFVIPVKAIAPRSSTALSVGTQVFNIGGDWVDDGQFNSTISSVTVADVPLPVTLISFDITREGRTAILRWGTTQEQNSDRFEIERSVDAKKWTRIGTTSSNGESSVKVEYAFDDKDPANGTNYYRLKMVDKDNTYAYSRIRNISFEGLPSLSVFPNPASDILYLKDVDLETIKSISIISTNGETVYSTERMFPVSSAGINLSGFLSGIYIVKITSTNGTLHTHKIVINR